jgi:hypothetical protein
MVLYFFILYINSLSKIVSDKSNPVLFADDMSINVINSNPLAFRNNINELFREINEWFESNLLSLIMIEHIVLQFVTKKNQQIDTQISFGNKTHY